MRVAAAANGDESLDGHQWTPTRLRLQQLAPVYHGAFAHLQVWISTEEEVGGHVTSHGFEAKRLGAALHCSAMH